jgi:hypothetical protein
MIKGKENKGNREEKGKWKREGGKVWSKGEGEGRKK